MDYNKCSVKLKDALDTKLFGITYIHNCNSIILFMHIRL